MQTRACKQCGKMFESRHKTAAYCGNECRAASRVIPRAACAVCGNTVQRARATHCSVACATEAMKRPKTLFPKPCEHCQTVFLPTKNSGRRFCSRACSASAMGLLRRKEKLITSKGYVQLYRPGHPMATKNGYVMEHRLVMAKKIGRNLLPSEIVHHINEVKSDNKPKNLMLMAKTEHDSLPKPKKSMVVTCPHCAGMIRLSNRARIADRA